MGTTDIDSVGAVGRVGRDGEGMVGILISDLIGPSECDDTTLVYGG